jgi:hypothetical protein
MMTVSAIMAGLLLILWSNGTGSEVMRPDADASRSRRYIFPERVDPINHNVRTSPKALIRA